MNKAQKTTGCQVKVQKVERPTNRSYYLNLPVVLAWISTERNSPNIGGKTG
jgi:hypothetical protein